MEKKKPKKQEDKILQPFRCVGEKPTAKIKIRKRQDNYVARKKKKVTSQVVLRQDLIDAREGRECAQSIVETIKTGSAKGI